MMAKKLYIYDVFIRNYSSLDRLHPAEMIVKDFAVIEVLIGIKASSFVDTIILHAQADLFFETVYIL